ncbi:MAG: hypothetical protein LCH54_13670 [Bacteroidetes bacterium]|nr:hypothetical protein [Bacteroidota bacterium]
MARNNTNAIQLQRQKGNRHKCRWRKPISLQNQTGLKSYYSEHFSYWIWFIPSKPITTHINGRLKVIKRMGAAIR